MFEKGADRVVEMEVLKAEIEQICQKHSISLELRDVSDPGFANQIGECIATGDWRYELVASAMSEHLFGQCRDSQNFEPLLEISEVIENHPQPLEGILLVLAQELRSALFWAYVRMPDPDIRFLRAESKILSLILGCRYEEALSAEACLKQGY